MNCKRRFEFVRFWKGLSFLILMLTNTNCFSPKKATLKKENFIEEFVNESVWVPRKTEESYLLKVKDSTADEINLIFEASFNDSIKIFIDSVEIFSTAIKTLKNQSVVDKEFKISYDIKKRPVITLYLMEKNKKVSFKPRKGYAFAYLSRQSGIWSVEFSNYNRLYY